MNVKGSGASCAVIRPGAGRTGEASSACSHTKPQATEARSRSGTASARSTVCLVASYGRTATPCSRSPTSRPFTSCLSLIVLPSPSSNYATRPSAMPGRYRAAHSPDSIPSSFSRFPTLHVPLPPTTPLRAPERPSRPSCGTRTPDSSPPLAIVVSIADSLVIRRSDEHSPNRRACAAETRRARFQL